MTKHQPKKTPAPEEIEKPDPRLLNESQLKEIMELQCPRPAAESIFVLIRHIEAQGERTRTLQADKVLLKQDREKFRLMAQAHHATTDPNAWGTRCQLCEDVLASLRAQGSSSSPQSGKEKPDQEKPTRQ